MVLAANSAIAAVHVFIERLLQGLWETVANSV
jgi:hypothetical protein